MKIYTNKMLAFAVALSLVIGFFAGMTVTPQKAEAQVAGSAVGAGNYFRLLSNVVSTVTSSMGLSVGSTTPNAKLLVQGTSGSTSDVFNVASSTGASMLKVARDGAVAVPGVLTVGSCVGCSTASGYDWTPTTYNGVGVNATTTGIWLQATSPFSLVASSTFATNASTTQFSVSGNSYFPLTGLLKGNGAGSAVTAAANGTDYTLLTAQTCGAGEFVSALTAIGGSTCTAGNAGTVTAISVASSNGFAGSSSGGATPALTLSTSITGLLKGNGTAISAATAGTDYLTGSLTKGNFIVGNDAGVAQATSTIFISSTGRVGVASSTPQRTLSVGGAIVASECNLTDGATVTFDLSTCNQGRVVLGGNRTLDFTNETQALGQTIRFVVCQDGTGTRTVTWDAAIRWAGGTAPTLTTTVNKCDVIAGFTTGATTTPVILLDKVLNF